MRTLPNPPRTEVFDDPEAVIRAMRRWFWAIAERDYSFDDPPRWTHDDNREAQDYGFNILFVEDPRRGTTHHALVPLVKGETSASIRAKIAKLAPIDPLCAKALAILTSLKLRGHE